MVSPKTGEVARGRVEVEPDIVVAGTVRLMTDEPIVVTSLDGPASLGHRVSALFARRPWLFPAGFLGLAGAYLVLRRR